MVCVVEFCSPCCFSLNSPKISLQGEEGDYQSVGAMAGLQRPELNYAALEFMRGRPREGRTGQGDDTSDYTEIKSK